MPPRAEGQVARVMMILHREVVLQVEWGEEFCPSGAADAHNG